MTRTLIGYALLFVAVFLAGVAGGRLNGALLLGALALLAGMALLLTGEQR